MEAKQDKSTKRKRADGKNPPPDGEFVMGSPFKYDEYDMCTLTPTNNTK